VSWLIIEPQFDGHHYAYLERIVAGARARDVQVVIGVGDDDQGERTISRLLQRFGDRALTFVVIPVPPVSKAPGVIFRLALNEIRRRRFFRDAFEKARRQAPIDFVFLPYLDWSLFAISLLGSPFEATEFAGITMRQRFHFKSVGIGAADDRLAFAKELLFRRLLRIPSLSKVLTIDETLVEYFARLDGPGERKIFFFPDPSDANTRLSREEARNRLSLPADACVVLVYGYLDARKAIDRLLDWLTSDSVPRTAILLAVGNQADDVQALFDEGPGRSMLTERRLRLIRKFVSEEEEAMFFRASDLVWLAYDKFELMSGALVRAAQHGLAVVFEDRGLIAHYARKYGREHRAAGVCQPLFATVPSGLTVRTFNRADYGASIPDHSWANAIALIYS
jgi:hypothetical protein